MTISLCAASADKQCWQNGTLGHQGVFHSFDQHLNRQFPHLLNGLGNGGYIQVFGNVDAVKANDADIYGVMVRLAQNVNDARGQNVPGGKDAIDAGMFIQQGQDALLQIRADEIASSCTEYTAQAGPDGSNKAGWGLFPSAAAALCFTDSKQIIFNNGSCFSVKG